MERKIGEIFEFGGEWYQCLKGLGCNECDLSKLTCYHRFESGSCSPNMRKDETQVIFKKLEKWGKPYPNADKLYQLYILPMNIEKLPPHTVGINLVRFDIVEIEIKQTKEDMEEKNNAKHSNSESIGKNLKEFDLQKAREGKPVCTRGGKKARIICFDRINARPILALVPSTDGKGEDVFDYFVSGKRIANALESDLDLMMLPEKKEGWAVIRREDIYETEEQAKKSLLCSRTATMIRKIEWEE